MHTRLSPLRSQDIRSSMAGQMGAVSVAVEARDVRGGNNVELEGARKIGTATGICKTREALPSVRTRGMRAAMKSRI